VPEPEPRVVDPDHRARDVEDVADAELVPVAHVAVHGDAAPPLETHVRGAEAKTVQQGERGVGEALEVVRDR
jgi:hypothetical protein